MYVPQLILLNEGPVTMTTMKLKLQLDAWIGVSNSNLKPDTKEARTVDKALAGPRIRRPTISAGYSQVIPSQPMAKNELKTKSRTQDTICAALLSFNDPRMASKIMVMHWPVAPSDGSVKIRTEKVLETYRTT